MIFPERTRSVPLGLIDSLNPKIWIVTASHGGRRGGLVATFVTPVSIVPDMPRFVVAIACQHATHDLIAGSQSFALHLLRSDQIQLSYRFGSRSGRAGDKFGDVEWQPGKLGCPILSDCLASLECRVEAALNIGDRTLFTGLVVSSRRSLGETPLTIDDFLAGLADEQREVIDLLYARDIPIDRDAIRDWQSGNRNKKP